MFTTMIDVLREEKSLKLPESVSRNFDAYQHFLCKFMLSVVISKTVTSISTVEDHVLLRLRTDVNSSYQ